MPYKNFKKTEIIDEIGAELRKIRTQKEFTLVQVADALEKNGIHLSATMLGRIETGERRIDDELLHALCDYYLTDPDTLIVRSCQVHAAHLQNYNSNLQLTALSEDAAAIVNMYLELPAEKQSEVKTMMRMLSYMDKFQKLNL